MGNCCSSPSPDPPRSSQTGGDPQQSQPRRQGAEPRRDETLSPPHQRRDARPEPMNPVKPGETNPASMPSQPDGKPSRKPSRYGTSNYPPSSPPLRRAASANTSFGGAGMPQVTGEEAYLNPLHKPGRPMPSSSPRNMSKSASERPSYGSPLAPLVLPSSTPRQEHVHGGGHKNGAESAPDPQSPKGVPKRTLTRRTTTRSFPPTVRDVLPDGFRYAILP